MRNSGDSTPGDGSTLRDRLRALPVLTAAPPPWDVTALPGSPHEAFAEWLDEAIAAEAPEPQTMTLSTVDAEGRPNARVLLLKDVDARGWWFATDLLGAKAVELEANPRAALTFYWPTRGRQVRIRGAVVRADEDVSVADFAARSPRARAVVLAARDLLRAAGSCSREELLAAADRRQATLDREHPAGPTDEVAPWAAFVVTPEEVEFWQADVGRLHLRVRYTRDGTGWTTAVLAH